MRGWFACVAAFVFLTGCSHVPGLGSSASHHSASAVGTPSTQSDGQLNAVSMPPEFPNDVPVYPDAKLTAAASFISQGQQAWGMEWETPAATTKVVAFYEKALTTGDWTLTVTSGSSGVYSGTTARRSDTSEHGTIAVNNDNAFTMIALTLSTPAG